MYLGTVTPFEVFLMQSRVQLESGSSIFVFEVGINYIKLMHRCAIALFAAVVDRNPRGFYN